MLDGRGEGLDGREGCWEKEGGGVGVRERGLKPLGVSWFPRQRPGSSGGFTVCQRR